MKVRVALVIVMILSLTACFTKETEKSQQVHTDNKKNITSKPTVDFRKAALINVEMGEKYLAMGQVIRAKTKFLHALKLSPKLPEAHSSIGYFYETVGDVEEAEMHHKQAIKLSEANKGGFYNNYGIFLCRQKRYKEADAFFNKAIKDKQYVKTAEAYENAGFCALHGSDEAKAYAYLEAAVRRDPQRASASLELARIEAARNHHLIAKDYLEKYRAQGEPTSRSLWLGIQINKKLGHANEVASAALLLKGKFPDSPEYKSYLESLNNG